MNPPNNTVPLVLTMPCALVRFWHSILATYPETLELEVSTWIFKPTVEECIVEWRATHKGIEPTRIDVLVQPRNFAR